MARNIYYYFKLRNGVEYAIKETQIVINCAIMRMYRELTEEQREFHLANPTASVQEVVACQLTPPYVPPAPELSEYISQKVKEFREACYGSVSVTTLEYAAAMDKSENPLADIYFSLVEARAVVTNFRAQAKKALTVYNTYKPQIESAQSVEAVDEAYNEAINELNAR